MKEVIGDLWTYPADFRVITTNGSVRRDGACVMGRGCAKEAAKKWPKLPYELGKLIQKDGNIVQYFDQYQLYTFPVKWVWSDHADCLLIAQSTRQFLRQISLQIVEKKTYVMPRPGCGNGHLLWEQVKLLLVDLPDNVHVIDFPKGPRA